MSFGVKHYIAEQNYSLLKKRYPDVLNRLETIATGPSGEVVFTDESKKNLKINQNGKMVFVHPEQAPEKDADLYLPKIKKDFSGVEILIGLGLGYAAKAILKQRPSIRYLVLIEHDPGIFLQALKCMDLTDLLTNPKVILGISPDSSDVLLGAVQKAIAFEDTQILEHPVLSALDPVGFKQIQTMIYNHVNTINIAGATKIRYGKKIVENRFTNLKSMGHFFLFENLLDQFMGIPAYIVAAGPSLDDNIHHLKQVQNKAVIICVDSALPTMIENKIFPDFVTSIDYKEDTYEKFAHKIEEIPKKTGLFVYSWTSPKVIKNFPGHRKFFLFSESGIDNWVNRLLNGKRYFASGASVANLNFIAAKSLGCSPVIFVGQDLCYSSDRCHSTGTILKAHDKMKESLETGQDLVWLKGVDGNEVPSTRDLKGILNYFEVLIENNPGDYINCSPGGAHIEGTRYMDLEEAVKTYHSDSITVDTMIDQVCKDEKRIKTDLIVNNLKRDLKAVIKAISIVQEVDGLLQKADTRVKGVGKKWKKAGVLPQNITNLLVQIDKANTRIDNLDWIWKILEDVTAQGLKRSEQMLFEIDALNGIPEKYPEWLKKSIKRLIYINNTRKDALILLRDGIDEVISYIEKETCLLKSYSEDDHGTIKSLAEHYASSGDYAIAETFINKYFKLIPGAASANFLMGCMAAQKGAIDEMNSYFSQVLRIDREYDGKINEFRRRMGEVFLGSADHFKNYDSVVARQLLIKGLGYCPFHQGIQERLATFVQEDVSTIDQADIKGKLRDQARALEGWKTEIDTHPYIQAFISDDLIGLIYYFSGKLNFLSGKKEDALFLFNKSVAYTPHDSDRILRIADLFLCAFDYDRGVAFLTKAIQMDSRHQSYWESFGDFLLGSGKQDEGITAYEQAFHYFPRKQSLAEKIADFYLQKGNQFHQNNEFDQAEQAYERGISFLQETSPLLIQLYNNKGSALKNLGDHESAMACYDKTLSIDPGYAEALYNKGDLLQSKGDLKSALEFFEAAVKSRSDFGIAYKRMGAILIKLGKHGEAESLLKKARQLSS